MTAQTYVMMGVAYTDPERELRDCERIMRDEGYSPYERQQAGIFAEALIKRHGLLDI